ncbi:MAG TPA: hypothetical protein VHF25_00535 [Nitriliruptorales bacterium]|nr:hypothetical protein [Nitriliruptorales bacterium]
MQDSAPTRTVERIVPDQRACTRCEGTQHLVASHAGLGKYRCDGCELVVGFDLETSPAEFLLHRGLPSRYSRQWFGAILAPQEQRLEPDAPAELR